MVQNETQAIIAGKWLREQLTKVLVPVVIVGLVILAAMFLVIPKVSDSVVKKAVEQIEKTAANEARMNALDIELQSAEKKYASILENIKRFEAIDKMSSIPDDRLRLIATSFVEAEGHENIASRLAATERRIDTYNRYFELNGDLPKADTPIVINHSRYPGQVEIRLGKTQYYFQDNGVIKVLMDGEVAWGINPHTGYTSHRTR